MAGTIVVDTIQSDSSYASKVNVTSNVAFTSSVNFTGGMQVGGENAAFSGYRNRIINGSFLVWQRNTSATNVSTTNNFFTADRFASNRNSDVGGGTVTLSSDVPSGFINSYKISRASGNTLTGGLYVFYSFESKDILDLRGKNVTLSFWAKCGANYTGGTASVILSYGTGTDEKVYQQTSPAYAINGAFNLTTTWQRFTFTGTLGSGMGDLGFYVYSGAHSGTAGADDSMYFTGFQLEKGTVATDFEYRPYSVELQLCRRYYYQSVNYASSSFSYTHADFLTYGANCGVSTWMWATAKLPVQMRIAPTITTSDQAGTTGKISIFSSSGGSQTNGITPYTVYTTIESYNVSVYYENKYGLCGAIKADAEI